MASDSLRVVIAGGGPAGLALANALEKANIDYVLLEGRNEIAPFLGASIATNANGLRILDQLGCADVIQENTNPMHFTRIWDFHDGHLIDKYMSLMMGHRR